MTILSKNLKRFRQAKSLTQEQAAEALGVSTQTVSRWECGTTLPDAITLPEIARLYCTTIDDLFQEFSPAYDNYAQRLGCLYESSRKPEDFLRAEQEYRKLLRSGEYSAEDLRLYAILYQYMVGDCIAKAAELFGKALAASKGTDPEMYWRVKRQQCSFLHQIGRDEDVLDEFFPLVEAGSDELQHHICLIQAYYLMEYYEKALYYAKLAEKKFPESAFLHLYCGDICAGLKRYEEAFAHWKRARALEPTWTDAAYSMAQCYQELGDWENAAATWQALADDLSRRGYDIEANWPSTRAMECKKRGQP